MDNYFGRRNEILRLDHAFSSFRGSHQRHNRRFISVVARDAPARNKYTYGSPGSCLLRTCSQPLHQPSLPNNLYTNIASF